MNQQQLKVNNSDQARKHSKGTPVINQEQPKVNNSNHAKKESKGYQL